MTNREEVSDLDEWSFIDYAVEQVRQRQPDTDLDAMRVVFTLHRMVNLMVYDLESTVHRRYGWSWAGFRVMFVLWTAGPQEFKDIARLSGMSRASVSALVKTLERDGLTDRTPSQTDGRAAIISLTKAGSRQLEAAYAEHNRREQQWCGALTASEQKGLVAQLQRMIEQVQTVEDIAHKD